MGIILDTYLTLDKQVNKLCKCCHFHLRNISKIRKYLTKDSTEILIHALVSSKLDHCNSLLYGLPAYRIQKLQRLQNTAARIVTLSRKYDHITPVLVSLHWLPVYYRVIFKILLLVYKGIHNLAPLYISELVRAKTYSRSLRSASKKILEVKRTNTKTYGDRAFSVAGPKLWNELPIEIKNSSNVNSFKRKLKTHLFKAAFYI